MIVCVAIISQKNNPIYLKCLKQDEPNPLKFDYLVYCSMDAIDDRIAAQKTKGAAASSSDLYFLGLLNVTPEYHVYGYTSATSARIVIVVDGPMNSDDVSERCAAIHQAYADAISNPFRIPGEMLESKKFDRAVERIALQSTHAPPKPPVERMAASVM